MGFIGWWGHNVTQSDGVPAWEKWAALLLLAPWVIGWFARGGKR